MRERIKRSFVGYENLVEEALPHAEKDVKYFLKYHKVKLERKFSFKLIQKNAITYDPNKVVTLRHFQFRRHGVYNHYMGPYKFTKVTITIIEKDLEVYTESVIVAPVSRSQLIFDSKKFLNELRNR
jgi:hypothetical protein